MELIAVLLHFGIVVVFGHDAVLLQRCHAGVGHNVCFKVQHTFDVTQGHVQDQAQTARQRFQEPDVCARCRQVNVTHAFATHFGLCHFNAALLADHAAVLQTLVFTAQAFVVFDGAKNLGAEQTITLRLERAIVDGFRLFNFAERPRTDFFGRSQSNADGIKMLVRCELLEQVQK